MEAAMSGTMDLGGTVSGVEPSQGSASQAQGGFQGAEAGGSGGTIGGGSNAGNGVSTQSGGLLSGPAMSFIDNAFSTGAVATLGILGGLAAVVEGSPVSGSIAAAIGGIALAQSGVLQQAVALTINPDPAVAQQQMQARV